MSQSVLTFLPALHGDAFIIHCYKGDNDGYIIVDGGPNINSRLNPFINEVEKISHIDLIGKIGVCCYCLMNNFASSEL